jgi:hypothetical protein
MGGNSTLDAAPLGTRPTCTYQLEALRAHLRDGAPLPIDADDALATMELIDACYRAAVFQPRPRTLRMQTYPTPDREPARVPSLRLSSRFRIDRFCNSRPPPLQPARQASRTRVRNQRRTTSGVRRL